MLWRFVNGCWYISAAAVCATLTPRLLSTAAGISAVSLSDHPQGINSGRQQLLAQSARLVELNTGASGQGCVGRPQRAAKQVMEGALQQHSGLCESGGLLLRVHESTKLHHTTSISTMVTLQNGG
jgi:hypothetical protein